MNEFEIENIKTETLIGNEFAPIEWRIEEIINTEIQNCIKNINYQIKEELKNV